MRLQCPNCDAEYEVDSAAIPAEGRDVQCSNCGHGWFQTHPDFDTDYELESALYDPPPPLPQAAPVDGAMPRREIDPAALKILREEAALEEAKRAVEQRAAQQADDAANLPPPAAEKSAPPPAAAAARATAAAAPAAAAPAMPPDDGFEDIEAQLDAAREDLAQPMPQTVPDAAPRATPRRVARLRGEGDEPSAAAPAMAAMPKAPASNAATASPAPLAPQTFAPIDMETSAAEMDAGTSPSPARKSKGRAGFYTAVLTAVIAVALYVMGPDIAARIPAVAGPLAGYVEGVNTLRDGVQVAVPVILETVVGAVRAVQGWLAGLAA